MENIDVLKHMGDLAPPTIQQILVTRLPDSTEWFSKKAFNKPIQLIERNQAMNDKKDTDKSNNAQGNQKSGYASTQINFPGSNKYNTAGHSHANQNDPVIWTTEAGPQSGPLLTQKY